MTFEWINPLIGGVLISICLGLFMIINNVDYRVENMVRNPRERSPSIAWNN